MPKATMRDFSGRVVMITGGTNGVGRQVAIAAARAGAKVAIGGRRPAPGEETLALIKNDSGGDAAYFPLDVGKSASVDAFIKATVERFGRIDAACNCAGITGGRQKPLHQYENAEFQEIVATNLMGTFYCVKAEVTQMMAQGGGVIVNVGSVASLLGVGGMSAYVASKHAILGMTKCAAFEYARKNIRINVVSPGGIVTDMSQDLYKDNPSFYDASAEAHPMGRRARPQEIADTVMWLFSDESSFVTGQSITVDGGLSARSPTPYDYNL